MLTGPEIRKAIGLGDIRVDPYDPENVGPCSVDLRLAEDTLVYDDVVAPTGFPLDVTKGQLDVQKMNPVRECSLPRTLLPGVLYLARTVERVWTGRYAGVLHGRSSLGRLGLVVHQTAGFVDPGFDGVITLELTVVHPVFVVPGIRVAQLAFEQLQGDVHFYAGKYQRAETVEPSKLHEDRERGR